MQVDRPDVSTGRHEASHISPPVKEQQLMPRKKQNRTRSKNGAVALRLTYRAVKPACRICGSGASVARRQKKCKKCEKLTP